MKKKIASILLCVTMISTLVAGCGSKAADVEGIKETDSASPQSSIQADTQTAENSELSNLTFAILVRSAGNPYTEKEAAGFRTVIEDAGATCVVKAPDSATAEAQITMINELVSQHVNAIAVAGNDADALQPALTAAMKSGIKVLSLDSAVNADSRLVHVNQAGTELIGTTLVDAVSDIVGADGGKFAILSATSQATNQNSWIAAMQSDLEKDSRKLELVKIAYGDDEFQKSVDETEALIKNYPDLKVICAPTTVGIMAAAKVVTDKNLQDKIRITGLGLPSEMADYIGEDKACPYMYLWNPNDIGALAAYTAMALVDGSITGATGETFTAGTLGDNSGKYTIVDAADGGTEIILGSPFKFDASNIEEWKTVY